MATWPVLFWRAAGGCASAVTLLLGGLALAGYVSARLNVARFRRRYRGRRLLICSRRHGWHDFIVNNAMPVLPATCEVIWSDEDSKETLAALRRLRLVDAKPLLVCVESRGVRMTSLHSALLPLRKPSARSEAVQSQVREILENALKDLESSLV